MAYFSAEDLDKLDDRGPRAGGGDSEWAKFSHDKNTGKPGKYRVRLLPRSATDPWPFFHQRMHYFYGESYLSGVCPCASGHSCPACDIFFTLWSVPELGEPKSALHESLSNLGPDQRAFANVYDYAREEFLVWSIPYGAFKKLESALEGAREDYDIILTDPEVGRDLNVQFRKFGKASAMEVPSMAPESSEVPEGWADALYDLNEKSRQREFFEEDGTPTDGLTGAIADQLGDHYDVIMELYEQYKKKD